MKKWNRKLNTSKKEQGIYTIKSSQNRLQSQKQAPNELELLAKKVFKQAKQ